MVLSSFTLCGSFFSNCSIIVFTVKYPCGKVFVKRKKRSVILPTESSNVTSEQDGPFPNGTSLEEEIVTTTESPTLPPRNGSSIKTPYVDTRIVGGDECHLGECPWQVNLGSVFCMKAARVSEGSSAIVHLTCLPSVAVLTASVCSCLGT